MANLEAGKEYSISGAALYIIAQAMWEQGREYGRRVGEEYNGSPAEHETMDAHYMQILTHWEFQPAREKVQAR